MEDEARITRPADLLDPTARELDFTLFYREHLTKLVGFLVVQGARPVLAADLAQEAMTEAYRQWDKIETPGAWVRTVASRKWWRRLELELAEHPSGNLTDEVLLSADESDEIESRHTFLSVIRELPIGQRQIMAWTYDGYEPIEIARLLNKDPATVRSTLRTARAALRRTYRPGEESS